MKLEDVFERVYLVRQKGKTAAAVYPDSMTPVSDYIKDMDLVLDWLFELVQTGVVTPAWISAEKVLPKLNQHVFIYIPEAPLAQIQIGYRTENCWKSIFLDMDYAKPITHWMALPQKPNGVLDVRDIKD